MFQLAYLERAQEYYTKAKEFTNWVNENLNGIEVGHARRNVEHIGTGERFELCICFYNVLLKNVVAF